MMGVALAVCDKCATVNYDLPYAFVYAFVYALVYALVYYLAMNYGLDDGN